MPDLAAIREGGVWGRPPAAGGEKKLRFLERWMRDLTGKWGAEHASEHSSPQHGKHHFAQAYRRHLDDLAKMTDTKIALSSRTFVSASWPQQNIKVVSVGCEFSRIL